MKEENKRQKLREELGSSIKREQRRNYIILYTVIIIVFIVMWVISYALGFFSFEEFWVNVLNNIIGILPPLLIFDFFNEKLTRDSSAMELSSKITETLISTPETMDLFTEEQKNHFIHSVIESVVKDKDVTEMISNNLKNYLKEEVDYKIRTEYMYNFELYQDLPKAYDIWSDRDDYFYIQEKLHYRIKYLNMNCNKMNSIEVKIGFLFCNKNLDSALRERENNKEFDNCIFRESLSVSSQDMNYFLNLYENNPEGLKKQFEELFKLDLQIDGVKGDITEVLVNGKGMLVKLRAEYDVSLLEHSVRLIFHMPMRWGSVIEAVIVDPTKAPKISLSYPEDVMDVEMYPFLSKGEESALEVAHEHKNGVYDIMINNEWMYPISGMVFTVKKKG